jgi:hypothetical protein
MNEEEDEANWLRRKLGFAIRNLQLAARAKGIELGPVSAQQVLEMAERGELKEVPAAVDVVRSVLNSLTALLVYVREERLVCPQPQVWSRLFDLLPDKRRVGNGWEPPLPHILAAWDNTSDFEKRERFLLHIRWAADHGAFEQVNQFVRAIPPERWHRFEK